MKRLRFIPMILCAGCLGFFVPTAARAQLATLADEIVVLSKGVVNREQEQAGTHIGGVVGGRESALGYSPGSNEPRIQGHVVPGAGRSTFRGGNRDVLSYAAGNGRLPLPPEMVPGRSQAELPSPELPNYGSLDMPEAEYEGPPDGLTIDTAIETLVRENYDLRTKRFEIPQARADILTASLRSNPILFAAASSIPYGNYSPARPGDIDYGITVVQAFDINHKRLARMDVASRAKQVLEAQYQDAVRMEIDNLYIAYVDVVAARETVRYAEASRDGLNRVVSIAESKRRGAELSAPDFERLAIQRDSAELGLQQAQIAFRQSQQTLAQLLNVPLTEVHTLEPRSPLRNKSPEIPPHEDLIGLAYDARPDLRAYRLGIARARSDVRLARKEACSDVFVLYSPYEFTDRSKAAEGSSSSWSVGAMTSVPVFNRNQGNIRRAEINVAQTQNELAGLERQVETEVERAYAEYIASRDVLQKLEKEILPRSRRMREGALKLLEQGETDALAFLAAQREHNDVIRQYRDALVRHRRSMLKLNTAVGERIMP